MKLLNGDCLEKLKDLKPNSIDSIICDPPYGLKFMGKKWDYDVPSVAIWRECLRVLKPGGWLLAFSGTRTYHAMAIRIENAGFEIKDQIMWVYGQGFPKSTDPAKLIDKGVAAKRAIIGQWKPGGTARPNSKGGGHSAAKTSAADSSYVPKNVMLDITTPSTPGAQLWDGWGSALKPACEPICMARKPLDGTIAENLHRWGVGALNIGESKIGTEKRLSASAIFGNAMKKGPSSVVTGRWPSNFILDEDAAELLDVQSGLSTSNVRQPTGGVLGHHHGGKRSLMDTTIRGISDSGGASRFFYVAKTSKTERDAGLEAAPNKVLSRSGGAQSAEKRSKHYDNGDSGFNQTKAVKNNHPTVKPIKLMEYLVRLVTPPKGIVLDPFMGSGSTGMAAKSLGFDFVGIELNPDYFRIAEARIKAKMPGKKDISSKPASLDG